MNMNTNDLNRLMKNASEKTGVNIGKMKQAADNGKLDDFINNNLSEDTSARLKAVLSNKSEAEKLLSSPQAKELLKNLLKD